MELILGTYTERLPHVDGQADGILGTRYDPVSGDFGPVRLLAAARNPSYLALSAAGDRLYAVHETHEFDGQPGGGLSAYARDPRTGVLTLLNSSPTGGEAPCHVSLDRSGRFVLAANFGGREPGSVTVFRLEPDGSLGAVTGQVPGQHAHMTVTDPVTGDILVADLGRDQVLACTLGPDGTLSEREVVHTARPGAGPRHLALHPDGRCLFVVNENDSTVCVLRRDGNRFTLASQVSTVPPGAAATPNAPAALRVSPSGRHVLVANRGHDSLAVLRFEAAAGSLSLTRTAPAPGRSPRDFLLTPDGRQVIAGSQDDGLLAAYDFDDRTGVLAVRHRAPAATPVCLLAAAG